LETGWKFKTTTNTYRPSRRRKIKNKTCHREKIKNKQTPPNFKLIYYGNNITTVALITNHNIRAQNAFRLKNVIFIRIAKFSKKNLNDLTYRWYAVDGLFLSRTNRARLVFALAYKSTILQLLYTYPVKLKYHFIKKW